jgi:LmbE family N-acetylglucosaminyl deacetylase
MKILTVMAHPDDAEVWAGGTLAKYVKHGHPAHIVVLTYASEDTRGKEAQEGARRLGCSVDLLGQRDMYLRETDGVIDQVLEVLAREVPEVLILHNPDDTHPDHEASFQIARRALIRWYAGPARPPLIPSVFAANTYMGMGLRGRVSLETFVDIALFWEAKSHALLAHQSQGPEGWIDRLRNRLAVLGARSGCPLAEGFHRLVLFNEPGAVMQLDPGARFEQ